MLKINNLTVPAYSNGQTLWHYKTSDKLDEVASAGYFNDADDMLSVGDMILVTAYDGGAQLFVSVVSINGVAVGVMSQYRRGEASKQ